MSVRIYLEIGHEAVIRTKKTQEGFTHDWEVFVRGANNAEIDYYVEKVVFYLHETFPKPKRVIKESPYSVKESGYAGFNLPIDIYLKNSQEPKKIHFNYDLQLQPSGPPIHNVQKEKYVFNSPPEDFKEKLIKGGGKVGSFQESGDIKSLQDDKNQMLNKPKLSGSDILKKHKIKEEPRNNSMFQDLFGTPITTTRLTLEPKPAVKDFKTLLKSEKGNSKTSSKYSPHKEKEKIKGDFEKKSKDDKKNKDKTKEREKSKEKNFKHDKSPHIKSPSPKRLSPKRSPSRLSSPLLQKSKDFKHDKEKRDKFDEKKMKKDKRDKDHKENKHKDHDDNKQNDYKEQKTKLDYKTVKDVVKQKDENNVSLLYQKNNKEKNKEKSLKDVKENKSEKFVLDEKKYKSKKKDKEKRDKKEEKVHKSSKKNDKPSRDVDRNLNDTEKQINLFGSPKSDKKEKNSNSLKVPENESHNTSSSSRDVSPSQETTEIHQQYKKEVENKKFREENEKYKKLRKDKRNDKEYVKKNKRKSDNNENDEPPEKYQKEGVQNNHHDLINSSNHDQDEVDYMTILRHLQHKIMALKSSEDLQRVVQLIVDTGKFEISDNTFDFDLCLLDRSTVKQLQKFFNSDV